MSFEVKVVNSSDEMVKFATLKEATKSELVSEIVAGILTHNTLYGTSKGSMGYKKDIIHSSNHPLTGIKEFVIVGVVNSENIHFGLEEILNEVRARII